MSSSVTTSPNVVVITTPTLIDHLPNNLIPTTPIVGIEEIPNPFLKALVHQIVVEIFNIEQQNSNLKARVLHDDGSITILIRGLKILMVKTMQVTQWSLSPIQQICVVGVSYMVENEELLVSVVDRRDTRLPRVRFRLPPRLRVVITLPVINDDITIATNTTTTNEDLSKNLDVCAETIHTTAEKELLWLSTMIGAELIVLASSRRGININLRALITTPTDEPTFYIVTVKDLSIITPSLFEPDKWMDSNLPLEIRQLLQIRYYTFEMELRVKLSWKLIRDAFIAFLIQKFGEDYSTLPIIVRIERASSGIPIFGVTPNGININTPSSRITTLRPAPSSSSTTTTTTNNNDQDNIQSPELKKAKLNLN